MAYALERKIQLTFMMRKQLFLSVYRLVGFFVRDITIAFSLKGIIKH